jgi:hypothetical protein
MKPRLCAADDCKQPFEPVQDFQKYCSSRCASRIRVRLCRQRKRYGGDDGGGPGRKRQPQLFSRSELHTAKRKPAKSVIRPKQDGLFPDDGQSLFATLGGAAKYAQDGTVSDNEGYNKYSVKSDSKRPSTRVFSTPEAPLAA